MSANGFRVTVVQRGDFWIVNAGPASFVCRTERRARARARMITR